MTVNSLRRPHRPLNPHIPQPRALRAPDPHRSTHRIALGVDGACGGDVDELPVHADGAAEGVFPAAGVPRRSFCIFSFCIVLLRSFPCSPSLSRIFPLLLSLLPLDAARLKRRPSPSSLASPQRDDLPLRPAPLRQARHLLSPLVVGQEPRVRRQ